jgi:SRSO17 transposase
MKKQRQGPRQTWYYPDLSCWAQSLQGEQKENLYHSSLDQELPAMTRIRPANHTVAFIDEYCAHYRSVFHNVRHFEQFTQLILGLVAETKRKSLPRLAKTVQGESQALHHFLAHAEWSVEEVRRIRLGLLQHALAGRPFTLCIDETGDRKKGKTTDYVAHQYIGNVHGLANGVVSVNAYGVLGSTTFPLAFRFYKPQRRLKPGDVYQTTPQLAVELIEDLQAQAFQFSLVLADSLYGESHDFTRALQRRGLSYVVAIRGNHPVWTFPGEHKRYTTWRPYARVFTDGTSQERFVREIIFGRRYGVRSYQLTSDPKTQPQDTTCYVMTNLPGRIQHSVGNTFGLRTWIEYGFKQAKDELGWADYRLTDADAIERWWEIVMCAYTLVSLQSPDLALPELEACEPTLAPVATHPQWDHGQGWKPQLNNLRLVLQPFVCACLLLPWLRLHPLPQLSQGLADLCALMNTYHPLFPI